MLKILLPVAEFVRSELSFNVPTEQQKDFSTSLLALNYHRARMFSALLVLVTILLSLPSDLLFVIEGGWKKESAFSGMMLLDSLTAITCIMFWFVFYWNMPKSEAEYDSGHRWLVRTFAAFLILFAVGATLIDQKISGALTFYFVCVLGMAGALILNRRERWFIFGGSFALLAVTLPFVQPNFRILNMYYTGAAEMTLFSWVISNLIFVNKSKDFVGKRLIERQQTEILRANRRLAEANLGLFRINELKSTLIAAATSDLKSPLMSIIGYSETWKGEAERTSGWAKSGIAISTLASRALETTTSILERAITTISNFGSELTPVDLGEVAASTIFLFSGRAAEKSQSLKSVLADGCRVLGEKEWATQIIEHLLISAILTAEPGAKIEISVKRSPTSGEVCLTVSHDQRLLSDEEVVRIFEDPARTFGASNVKGINFWLVKQYVEAMKGTIRCESSLESGTRFLAEFPPFIG
jgi:signal transduction histidine kinase